MVYRSVALAASLTDGRISIRLLRRDLASPLILDLPYVPKFKEEVKKLLQKY